MGDEMSMYNVKLWLKRIFKDNTIQFNDDDDDENVDNADDNVQFATEKTTSTKKCNTKYSNIQMVGDKRNLISLSFVNCIL